MAAHEANDWRGVLKLEGRMEEMMGRQTSLAVMMERTWDAYCETVLHIFVSAHAMAPVSTRTGGRGHALSVIRLQVHPENARKSG